jgi:hypothetical protein
VFILDAGLKLFYYAGAGANKAERGKGLELINRIRDNERGARAEVGQASGEGRGRWRGALAVTRVVCRVVWWRVLRSSCCRRIRTTPSSGARWAARWR